MELEFLIAPNYTYTIYIYIFFIIVISVFLLKKIIYYIGLIHTVITGMYRATL